MKLRNRIPTRARPSRCSLLALPEEVVLLILKRLTANELMCLRMVGIQTLVSALWMRNIFTFCRKWQGFRDRWKVEDAVFVRPLNVRFVVDFIRCVYLSFLQVCSRLKSVIDDSPTLWISASFLGVWPSLKNLQLLKRFNLPLFYVTEFRGLRGVIRIYPLSRRVPLIINCLKYNRYIFSDS